MSKKTINKIYFNFNSPDKPKYKEITIDHLEELVASVYSYDNVRILGDLEFDKEKYPNIFMFANVMANYS